LSGLARLPFMMCFCFLFFSSCVLSRDCPLLIAPSILTLRYFLTFIWQEATQWNWPSFLQSSLYIYRTGLQPIGPIGPKWTPRLRGPCWGYLSLLVKYTQQHTAGFTENNWDPYFLRPVLYNERSKKNSCKKYMIVSVKTFMYDVVVTWERTAEWRHINVLYINNTQL